MTAPEGPSPHFADFDPELVDPPAPEPVPPLSSDDDTARRLDDR